MVRIRKYKSDVHIKIKFGQTLVKTLTCILIKKIDFILYNIYNINIFIGMVICVAADCKSDSRQGKV